MGIFTDSLTEELRLEYMKPEQVQKAKEKAPYVYVPFGSIEWHGYHNVLGLDAVKAHEQLVGLAVRKGGVVYPAVFFGSGGGHTEWPSTYMFSKDPLILLTTELLQGFDRQGYKKVILLSGHYPNRDQFLDQAILNYKESGGQMDVLALVENQVDNVGGDHAAKYETSFMMYLHPEKVDWERLTFQSTNDIGGAEEIINYMDVNYKDHPCYGLVGIDPRSHASVAVGQESTENLLVFLENWLIPK